MTRQLLGIFLGVSVGITGLYLAGCRSQRTVSLTTASESPTGPVKFQCDPAGGASCGSSIRAVWLDAKGERGWAIGQGIMLRYDGRQWLRDESGSIAAGHKDLKALWFEPDGLRGWAVGEDGRSLRYDHDKWTRDPADERSLTELNALWIDSTGQRGWAVGVSQIARYSGEWMPDQTASKAVGSHVLSALWMDLQGNQGWAAGQGGLFMRYDGHQWTQDKTASQASVGKDVASLWMDAQGEHGWAVGKRGIVLHFDGKWELDAEASKASGGGDLATLWMDAKGEHGWAVGHGVVLIYDGGRWSRDERASRASRGADLTALWLNAARTQGWAFGVGGVALRYNGKEWLLDERTSGIALGNGLNAIWLDGQGEQGWAVGEAGVILRLQGSRWMPYQATFTASGGNDLKALWLNRAGDRGWAVGWGGVVVRYESAAWTPDAEGSKVSGGKHLYALSMDATADHGWAAGQNGIMLRYENGHWALNEQASRTSGGKSISAMWMNQAGTRGWAGGEDGVILNYRDGRWALDRAATSASDGDTINALWFDENGDQGWAIGGDMEYEGGDTVVLQYASGQWHFDDQATDAAGDNVLESLWVDGKGGRGFVIGGDELDGSGVVLRLSGGRWIRDQSASSATHALTHHAIALDRSGTKGWAVGDYGAILGLTTSPVGSAEIDANFQNLSGRAEIHFRDTAPVPNSVQVTILDSGGATLIPSEPQYFSAARAKDSDKDYVLTLEPRCAAIAAIHKGQPFQLHVRAGFGDRSSPTEVTFVPESRLYVKGAYWLLPYLYTVLGVLFVNLALIAGAVYSTWVRRLALDPNVRLVLGVGVFKYILTEPLLVHVSIVRRTLFRDYRKRLDGHLQLSQWKEREYVVPDVNGVAPVPAWKASGPSDAESTAVAYAELVDGLFAKSLPGRPVWLLRGPSGLGKSAFLQQIAIAALRCNLTPLLVPLGAGSPEEEIATLMSEYGDMNVDGRIALDMVDGGGFIILLDAINEDRNPAATAKFLRKAWKRNVVLVTSQYAPVWPSSVPADELRLSPFGRAQLERILPEGWVDKVIDSPHLSTVIGLPITAFLLSKYIARNRMLPASDFAIYTNLREGLNPVEVLNLDEKAWVLFTDNGQQFKPDDHLTAEFCEAAVRANILTRRSSGTDTFYRFAHEKVHRFCVACYLSRQDGFKLAEWHTKVAAGLGKRYWADVIEFMGATRALAGGSVTQRTLAYTGFVREAAEFSPESLADRLYRQYQRYRETSDLAADQEFQDWAARFLADALSGKHSETRASATS
jgi:hypothetical protein